MKKFLALLLAAMMLLPLVPALAASPVAMARYDMMPTLLMEKDVVCCQSYQFPARLASRNSVRRPAGRYRGSERICPSAFRRAASFG